MSDTFAGSGARDFAVFPLQGVPGLDFMTIYAVRSIIVYYFTPNPRWSCALSARRSLAVATKENRKDTADTEKSIMDTAFSGSPRRSMPASVSAH